MISLISLSEPTIELPYYPDMLACDYLRDVIATAANFRLESGQTVRERVLGGNGLAFNFENRLKPLKDFVDDGGRLYYVLPLGPSLGTYDGNASRTGGGNMQCPVCLEDSYDVALECLHRGHAACFMPVRNQQCPMCRIPFTPLDIQKLHLVAGQAVVSLPLAVTNRPTYYWEPTVRMLEMLEERFDADMDPTRDDYYFGREFVEYRVVSTLQGTIHFEFWQNGSRSTTTVRALGEFYTFHQVTAFEVFLESTVRAFQEEFNADLAWGWLMLSGAEEAEETDDDEDSLY